MKPLYINILNVEYRRPGKSKVSFLASYGDYFRRGVVLYDTVAQRFLSHNKDLDLLAAVCEGLQKPRYSKAY